MEQSNFRAHLVSRNIVGWVGAGLAGATVVLVCPAASAATLSSWQFDPATQALTVTLPSGVTPRFLVAAEPARIILEIPNTQLGDVETSRQYDGAVRSVRLTQTDANTLRAVLELAPGTVLDPNHAQLTSMASGGQTRWVLTPLIAATGTVAATPQPATAPTNGAELPALPSMSPTQEAVTAPATAPASEANAPADDIVAVPSLPETAPAATLPMTPPPADASPSVPAGTVAPSAPSAPAEPSTQMVVELPVIPAAEAGMNFPEAGQGRLSTTAANLMLPSDIDDLENLPETLPIDPFSIGLADNEQVTVPGLDELDATVGPVAVTPQAPPTAATRDAAQAEPGGPIATAPPGTESAGSTEATSGASASAATGAAGETTGADTNAIELAVVPPEPEPTVADAPAIAPDTSTTDAPDADAPDDEASAADYSDQVPSLPITTAPPVTATAETNPPEAVAQSAAATPGEPDGLESAEPAGAPPDENTPSTEAVATEPLPLPEPSAAEPAAPPEVEPATAESAPLPDAETAATAEVPLPAAGTSAITVAPPGASRSVEPSPSTDVLAVPEMPDTRSAETVTPPSTAPASEYVVATANSINFGQPLPGAEGKALEDGRDGDAVTPGNQQVPPDILIAAGTVLELRYPGNQPLVLEPGTDLQEVLLLETEIRDPITQGVLAPRGSQLLGQFRPSGTNQQWVSEMIIVPAGQRVPLASTSEYLVGSPQVQGGRLAAGTGLGALALTLLTGFSGIGLLGGAVMGATTMVGTSPQQVVIEPNQIIAVQVTENVPRSMPIAAGPDLSREWGLE